jgi:pimeloyl-ACP methyl ester carboxylesterase
MDAARAMLNFAGGLTDHVMTRIPGFMVGRSDVTRETYLERLAYYAAWPDDIPFFPVPDVAPLGKELEEHPYGDGQRLLYVYPSRFAGHNPAMQEELRLDVHNRSAYVHVWRHGGNTPRPLVLCVHGFAMEGPARAERMFKIDRLFQQGLNVALYHLPHHWWRAERRGKSEFLRPEDVPRTIEEWVRNVHDLHSGVLLLESLGYGRIGILGASLGGLTGALYATVRARVEFLFLVVPAIDLTSFLLPRPGHMSFPPD